LYFSSRENEMKRPAEETENMTGRLGIEKKKRHFGLM